MDNEKANKIINEIKSLLSKKYKDFRGIYFYGSRVRGDNEVDSDYDLLFVFDREIDWLLRYEIYDLIYEFDLANDIIIDCKVDSLKYIENSISPFHYNVKMEGVYFGV